MHSVYVRIALYVLSPILTLLVAAFPEWGVHFDAETNVLSVNLEVLLGAIFAGGAVSFAIFRIWGVR